MVLAKAVHGEIRILERLGEKVQLAAGIDEQRLLSEEAMLRGLDCLGRFAQLIAGLPEGAVRIVGTNALREARNRGEFIRRAEAILGHPVEVIFWPRRSASNLSRRVPQQRRYTRQTSGGGYWRRQHGVHHWPTL